MKKLLRSPRFRALLIVGILVLLPAGVLAWRERTVFTSWVRERPFRVAVPSALPAAGGRPAPTEGTAATALLSSTPAEGRTGDVNLDVPFAPQAPFRNWGQPYQDACEEAAIIMVERALRGATLSREEMDTEILRVVDFETEHFGSYKDTTAAETARFAEAFYPHLRAEVRYDVTADDLIALLHEGHPVILPVNGRKLGNPFYTPPGPDKHALVIKGLKGDRFITNDPGIGRGNDFTFPVATVMAAAIDYDGIAPGTGKRAAIILTQRGP